MHAVLSQSLAGCCGGDHRGYYPALEVEGPPSSLSHLHTGLTATGEALSLVTYSSKPHGLPDSVWEVGGPGRSCLSPEDCENQG